MNTMNTRPLAAATVPAAHTFVALAIATGFAPIAAHAQTDASLPPVVIKATKVDEPLLGSPHSVTVFTAQDVENNRIRTVEDLSKFTPNLKLDNGYGAGSRGFLSIRGVGNTPGSMDPSASIYVDDVPYHDFLTYAQPLFDIQQIEVLKGPQGTLYGGFAQAGVIDIRSTLPGKDLKRSVSVDVFSPRNARTTAAISGPVNDVLSLGVSVLEERGESFVRNITLGKNSDRQQTAARVQGVFRPDASTEAVLTVLSHRQRNNGGSDYLPVNRTAYNALSGVSTSKFEIANNIEGFQNLDTDAQSLRLKRQASGVEYTIVAANRDSNVQSLVDFDYRPTNAGFLNASASQDKISNQYFETRARILPKTSSAADITVGYSWMRQKYDVFNTVNLGSSTYDIIQSNGSNTSVFTSSRLPINKDGLALIGGLRYEQAARFGQNGPSTFRTGNDVVVPTSIDSNQVTWKLGFSTLLSSGADLYSHVASGWRPAAVNYYSDGTNPRTVDKESSLTYEVGYRQANSSRYFAAALFLTRISDYQETLYGSGVGAGYLANVAKVDIPGMEIEGRQTITRAVSLFGGLGFTRARYAEYLQNRSLEGQALGNRPDWNVNAGVEYRSGQMTYAATVIASDSYTSAYTSTGASSRVDGYLVGNLRMTYQDKNYAVTGFVNNLSDQEYFLNAGYYNYNSNNSGPRGMVGAPRTVGVS